MFTGGQKVQKLASFKTSLKFSRSRLKMQQDIRILKQQFSGTMIALWTGQSLWGLVHPPLRKLCQFWSTL